MAEAAISLPMFLLVFLGAQYFHDAYAASQRARHEVYRQAMSAALNGNGFCAARNGGAVPLQAPAEVPAAPAYFPGFSGQITRAAIAACRPWPLPRSAGDSPLPVTSISAACTGANLPASWRTFCQ